MVNLLILNKKFNISTISNYLKVMKMEAQNKSKVESDSFRNNSLMSRMEAKNRMKNGLEELAQEIRKEGRITRMRDLPYGYFPLPDINQNEFIRYLFQFSKLTSKISYGRKCDVDIKTNSDKHYSNSVKYKLLKKKDDPIKEILVSSPIILPQTLGEMYVRVNERIKREDPIKPWLKIENDSGNYRAEFLKHIYDGCDLGVISEPFEKFIKYYSEEGSKINI